MVLSCLPIELKVLQNLKSHERKHLDPLGLRKKATEYAKIQINNQLEGFRRWGIWGDWDNPYLTLKKNYESAQIGVFGKMFLNGYIYRGLKPVHWSPSSRTALAEAELEYPEVNDEPFTVELNPVSGVPVALEVCPVTTFAPEKAV